MSRQRIDPLSGRVPIVDPQGRPTETFIRQWLQAKNVSVTIDGVTVSLTELQAALAQLQPDVAGLLARQIVAGAGLDGGGPLSADVPLALATSGVTPGNFTNANISVDAFGRVTAAGNGAAGGGGTSLLGSVVGPVDLTATGSTAVLGSVNVPAGTMNRDGDVLQAEAQFLMTSTGANRVARLGALGAASGLSVATAGDIFLGLRLTIIRRSASTGFLRIEPLAYTTTLQPQSSFGLRTALTGIGWTQPFSVVADGNRAATTAGVRLEYMFVEKKSAP